MVQIFQLFPLHIISIQYIPLFLSVMATLSIACFFFSLSLFPSCLLPSFQGHRETGIYKPLHGQSYMTSYFLTTKLKRSHFRPAGLKRSHNQGRRGWNYRVITLPFLTQGSHIRRSPSRGVCVCWFCSYEVSFCAEVFNWNASLGN